LCRQSCEFSDYVLKESRSALVAKSSAITASLTGLRHFNPNNLLRRWESKPQLVLGDLETADIDAEITAYP
tara:strand:+ start:152 stop:364 length:213 start_codon:yes stop_codon:yes gene_type:complete